MAHWGRNQLAPPRDREVVSWPAWIFLHLLCLATHIWHILHASILKHFDVCVFVHLSRTFTCLYCFAIAWKVLPEWPRISCWGHFGKQRGPWRDIFHVFSHALLLPLDNLRNLSYYMIFSGFWNATILECFCCNCLNITVLQSPERLQKQNFSRRTGCEKFLTWCRLTCYVNRWASTTRTVGRKALLDLQQTFSHKYTNTGTNRKYEYNMCIGELPLVGPFGGVEDINVLHI